MNNLLTIFKFEFKNYLTKKSSIITFIIYAIVAFGITLVPNIISHFSDEEAEANFAKSGYIIKDITDFNFDKAILKDAKQYDSREQLEKDIKEEKIDEGIVLSSSNYDYIVNDSLFNEGNSPFQETFDIIVKDYMYSKNGLNYKEISQLEQTFPKANLVTLSKDSIKRLVNTPIIYFLSFVLYMTVILFGTVVASNTAREKTNRAMELLIVTVDPKSLIVGKVLAFSSIAMAQIAVLIGTFLIGVKVNGSHYSETLSSIAENLDYQLLATWFIFSIVGFLMYMFVYAGFASLVNKIEEVNTVVTLPMLLFIGTFFANMYILGSGGDSMLAKILSVFPLTSFFIMPTRYAIADVNYTTLGLSFVLLVATTIILALASIKVYRSATLRYGQKLNFFKLLFSK